jgi:dinuclear metal center YbgI/SA1388 family protein
MKVRELYEKLSQRIPEELSEPWDNDGLMCCTDDQREVRRVLVSLDVTEEIVDYALDNGFDLILSHHPLIFRPISSVTMDNHVSRKLIKLVTGQVSVISLHTRADKVKGGVNDCLARLLGLSEVQPFGEGGLGRIGHLEVEMAFSDFAAHVKEILGSDAVLASDGYNPVYNVALVGGDGKDFVADALEAGADTYLSGRISYNVMEEAAEMGINLVEAGHYATEFPVTSFFAHLISKLDPRIDVEIIGSYMIATL